MKKSKFISLVLITSALASCNKRQNEASWDPSEHNGDGEKKVYMRSDTSAGYSRTYRGNSGLLGYYYYAFRPYGMFNGYTYQRVGYSNNGLSEESNIGTNGIKSSVSRGGFGESGMGGGE